MKPVPFLLVLTLVLTGCFSRVHHTPDDSFQLERNSEFDGAVLRFFVTLDDGTEVSVNTAGDVFEALPGATPVPGHQARAWTFLKEADDGMFERDRVTLRHPERTVTHAEGGWGGAVSSRQDTDGNPRLIAGFSGVSFEESDGSEGEFFGSFLGLSESFRETGESGPLPESED